MPERIVYITESSGYGGAEKYLLHLCQRAKITYTMVSVALHFNESNSKLRSELDSIGIDLIDVRYFKGLYPLNLFQALSFFRNRRDTFFHFSLPFITSCPQMLIAASLLRRPYVITEHLAPPTPRAGGPYVLLHYFLFNTLKRLAYRRADHVVAVSRYLKNILVRSYGMPGEKITVIHNGVNAHAPSKESPEMKSKLDIPANDIVITNVARLDEQKGQTFLVTALKEVVMHYPDITVLMVGDGPDRSRILRQAQRDNIGENIKFLGFRDDVPDILGCTDIFVLPSLNEGFPFSIVEAMSAGLPVIATRVGGNAEAVIDGETGILVDPGDAAGLSAALKMLIGDREKRTILGAHAKARALSEFSLAGMREKTFALYPRP